MIFQSDKYAVKKLGMLQQYYSVNNQILPQCKKSVVFMEDGRGLSGGLSDRLRGAIFTYLACQDLGIPFYINFNTPFRLENYLEPNTYNWTMPEAKISYNSNQSESFQIESFFESQVEYVVKYNKMKRSISKSNKMQVHIYTNMKHLNKERYSKAFNDLFKPTAIVQNTIDYHRERIGEAYVNVTLRFQNLLGDFNEGVYKTITSETEKLRLIEVCEHQIILLHNKYPNKTILVTSDSKRFLDRMNELPYTYIIEGEMVHMAYTNDNSLELHKKAFVDYLMIAGAEKIYLLCTGDMYQSGFPYTASLIYNKPFELIKF